MKLLILAEKSSAAQNFSKALGGMSGTFESDSYQIVHSHGHLLKLLDPDKQVAEAKRARYEDWKSYKPYPWDLNDFAWKKGFIDSSSRKLARQIKEAAQSCDAIVIATDNDPSGEGDLLGWEIINAIGWRSKVYRMRFEDEEKDSVIESLKNKTDVTDQQRQGEYLEAVARERFDFDSMQLTRIATLAARQQGMPATVLRLGRLKSVIVKLVYDQLEAISRFVKKPYYEVRYKDGNGNIFSREYHDGDQFRYDTQSQAQAELNNFAPDNVEIDSTVTKKQQPPQLVNLSALAALLAKQGFSPSSVLATYQKMYEAGVVSYPRTEDKKMTQQQFDKLLDYADEIADVVGVDKSLLTHRTARKKFLTKAADHGANRPGYNVPSSLDEVREKWGKCGVAIYQQLAKSYLAILCEDYEYEQTKAHLKNHPDFKATSNTPKTMAYKLVFNENALDDDSKANSNKNGFASLANSFVYQGSNTPPKKPTFNFIRLFLERNNIGTGATQTSTIADISKKNDPKALLKQGKSYTLTAAGRMSAILTEGTQIADKDTTKQMLDYMDQVKVFKISFDKIPTFMTEIVKHDMPIIRQNAPKLKQDKELLALASNMKMPVKVTGVYLPTKEVVSFHDTFGGHKFTKDEQAALLAGKQIEVPCKSRKGTGLIVPGKLGKRTYKGHEFWGFVFDPKQIKFPDDGTRAKGIFVPTGEQITFKKVFAKHEFTPEEIKTLLAGKPVEIQCKSKNGKDMLVSGKLANKEFKGKKYWGFDFDLNSIKLLHDDTHVSGIYAPTNEKIRFKKSWASHTFTKAEQEALLAGKEIEIPCKSKKGTDLTAKGKLAKQEYQGRSFWGFQAAEGSIKVVDDTHTSGVYKPTGEKVRFKKSWGGHDFTPEEIKNLLAGQKVKIALKGKKGTWHATGALKKQSYKGHEYWGFDVEEKEWS